MKTVAFHTLGCKVNTYETEAMKQLLTAAGYKIVDFEEKSDIYIINTCSVTNMADRKSRQMLHKARKENPEAVVIAAGCYVQAASEDIIKDLSIDIIVGNNMKQDIVKIIEEYYDNNNKVYMIDIAQTKDYENLHVSEIDDHTRAFVKIQDGCNQFCSYCIIPYTRGRVRSRKAQDIIDEVKELAIKGFREIVLTGIHLPSYGVDFIENSPIDNLLSLIMNISEVDSIERVRLGSLEPRVITEQFLEVLSKNSKFCPHFHLSLQSGCDETLKRMNRRYTTDEYYKGVELIRKYYPDAAITTDVIVGFPGETLEEFQETCDFVKKVSFFEMHIFPYSRREGTKAAKMPAQLTSREKSRRAEILTQIDDEMSDEFRKKRLGRHEVILSEDKMMIEGNAYYLGHTKEYVKVAIPVSEGSRNKLVEGDITSFLTKNIMLMSKIVGIL